MCICEKNIKIDNYATLRSKVSYRIYNQRSQQAIFVYRYLFYSQLFGTEYSTKLNPVSYYVQSTKAPTDHEHMSKIIQSVQLIEPQKINANLTDFTGNNYRFRSGILMR